MAKLLIIDVAALGWGLLEDNDIAQCAGLRFAPTEGIFPAVTCSVQASFRTGLPCGGHGMVGNGRMYRELGKALFWEQSAGLVQGRRIWEGFRNRGGKVGLMFWQQSLGEAADLVLSPAPIHRHHGGMIQDCYSQPPALYGTLCDRIGKSFKLRQYWGPLASAKVGDWIAAATADVLRNPLPAPQLMLMTYLPSLDYDLQRYGPDHHNSRSALKRTLRQLELMIHAARQNDFHVVVFGDYAIAPATQVAHPNRALLEAGLLRVREVRDMLYADLYASRAFAVADHEIAHVYVPDPQDLPAAAAVLGRLPGVGEVLDRSAQSALGLDHANAGELVLVAAEGCWFDYRWWNDPRQRPDYAAHVDIHNKPGYDPCELFFGWPPPSVSQNPGRIKGTHGRVGEGRQVAWASTLDLGEVGSLLELSAAVRSRLENS